MDTEELTARPGTARSAVVLITGAVVALWIVFGRFLFGRGGELTIVYLLIGFLIVVLTVFISRAMARTAARGFSLRPSVWGTLGASWGCGLLLGLTIPDLTSEGLQTILSGTEQPWLDFAIGVANPSGIIMTALTIAALVLANQDAHGPRPHEDDLL